MVYSWFSILMVDWVWSIVTLTKITINIWLILISAGFTCLHIISLECLDPNSKPDIFRHWMVNTIVLGNGLVLNGTMAGLICMNVKRDAISCFASFQPIQISKGRKYFFHDVASWIQYQSKHTKLRAYNDRIQNDLGVR